MSNSEDPPNIEYNIEQAMKLIAEQQTRINQLLTSNQQLLTSNQRIAKAAEDANRIKQIQITAQRSITQFMCRSCYRWHDKSERSGGRDLCHSCYRS
jgi:hypothetical protein